MNKKLCYRVILRFEYKYPIGEMCRLFNVSYSSYYKWRLRQQQPDRDTQLIHKAVYRVMRKLGIKSVARRRRSYIRYSESIHRYENILNRDFKAERCNQYTSHAYFRLTQEYDITPSMSRRGNCLDNSCIENFFGMLKTEWIQKQKFITIDEAREAVEQYIHYYNYERCNLKTKLTPYEKRCQSA